MRRWALFLTMAKRRYINTNFRLGLNRQELIEAAQLYGKKLSVAKKDSTKRLEEYLVNKLAGRGSKVPQFNPEQKREIRQAVEKGGVMSGVQLTAYRIKVATGTNDRNAYLRLSIGEAFAAFYDKGIRSEHIDELMSRMPSPDDYDNIAGIYEMDLQYVEIFETYAEELRNRENR